MIIARDVDSCCRAWCPTLSSHRWTPGHAMAFIFQRYAPSIDGNMMSRYQNVKGNMYLRTRDSCWLNWTWFVSFCFFVAWKQLLECTLFRKSGEDDHTVSEIREMFCLFLCLFICLFVCLFVCFVSLFLCFFVSLFVCLFVCLIRYYTHSLSSNSSVTLIADSSIADQSVCAFGPPWRAYSLTMSRYHFSWKPQRTIEVNTTELKNGIPKKCAEIINQWTSVMGNFGKSISRELIHSESICVELRHDVVIFFPRGRWLSSRNAVFCCLFLPAAKWTLIFTRYFTCVAPWGLDIFYCEGKLGQSDVRYLTPKYCLNASLFCSPRKGIACRSMEIYLDLYYWHLGLLYANSNLHENIAQIDLDFFPCRCCWVNPQSVKAELGFLNMESMCAQTPLLGFTHSDFPVSHQLFACWQSSSSWRFIGQRPHILGCHVWLRIPLLCPNTSPTQPMAMGQQAQNRDLALLHGNFMTFTVKIISCR